MFVFQTMKYFNRIGKVGLGAYLVELEKCSQCNDKWKNHDTNGMKYPKLNPEREKGRQQKSRGYPDAVCALVNSSLII